MPSQTAKTEKTYFALPRGPVRQPATDIYIWHVQTAAQFQRNNRMQASSCGRRMLFANGFLAMAHSVTSDSRTLSPLCFSGVSLGSRP